MKRTYHGSCRCGTVRFQALLDLTAGTFRCNCRLCTKTRMWGAVVRPDELQILAGENQLTEYQPETIHHLFCRRCGVESFGWGDNPALGGKFYAIRVACLDDATPEELIAAPVRYSDGANDNYGSPPAEVRHL